MSSFRELIRELHWLHQLPKQQEAKACLEGQLPHEICFTGFQLVKGFNQLITQAEIAGLQLEYYGKGPACCAVGLTNDFIIKMLWIHAKQLVEVASLTNCEAVSYKDTPKKEAAEQSSSDAVRQSWPAADQEIENISMAVFVLTPWFKEVE